MEDETTAPEIDTETASEPAAETAPTKTVEQWATDKGFFPQVLSQAPRGQAQGVPTDKGYAAISFAAAGIVGPSTNPDYWRFAAAKAMHRWPEGLVVTETEFDEAVHAATDGVQIR